jgi:hypothetical protein
MTGTRAEKDLYQFGIVGFSEEWFKRYGTAEASESYRVMTVA